jgi:hypothetical protein
MPVSKGKNCVKDEMHQWKHDGLHSGTGKKGKDGKLISYPSGKKQAIAVALSVCGKSKADHSESLQSLGYSEDTVNTVLDILYGESPDWKQQFKTGDPGKNNPQNYKVDPWFVRNDQSGRPLDIDSRPGKQKGNQGKQEDNESGMISPVAFPKGPGNPQGGSSKEVSGLRMLG